MVSLNSVMEFLQIQQFKNRYWMLPNVYWRMNICNEQVHYSLSM